MQDDQALFAVLPDSDRRHQTAAMGRSVTGLIVDVNTGQAGGAMVGVAIAVDDLIAGSAVKVLIDFAKSLSRSGFQGRRASGSFIT